MFKFIAVASLASLSAVACASAPEGDDVPSVEEANIEQASGFIPIKPVKPRKIIGYPPGSPFCGTGVSCGRIAVDPGGVIVTPQPMFYSDGKTTYAVRQGTRLVVPALVPILEGKQLYYCDPNGTAICEGTLIPGTRSYSVTFTPTVLERK